MVRVSWTGACILVRPVPAWMDIMTWKSPGGMVGILGLDSENLVILERSSLIEGLQNLRQGLVIKGSNR